MTPHTGAFLAQARDWLAAHVPPGPPPSVDTAEGFAWHREWERSLAASRLSVVSWPAEYGGREASLLEWLSFEEAYYAAGGPVRVGQNGLFLLAPTLFAHGTQEQRDRLLPPMARADEIWAQAWSEPEAGSDLAAIRSRAVATDGGWLLSGTKTWSSRAAFADRAFGLFRTSAGGGDRHRGLTYLLFGLHDPGVTVRPIRQLGGETGFAEIFLDDVFVPDANVVGAPGDGWRIAMSTASHERGLSLRSPGRFVAAADRLGELWRQAGDPADGATADGVTDAWIGARAYQLHTNATAVRLAEGGALGAEASMGKVFWSELDIALHETALDLLGPRAEIRGERWLEGYLFALAGPIYAGTNEIQRTVIAERVLRLPRASARPSGGDLPQASRPPGATVSQPSGFQPPQPTGRPPVPAWAAVLHDMLSAADGPATARSWADGDLAPGLALWGRLAGLGVTALAVPEKWGGLGPRATDLATACEELGHHAVPGPVAESLAVVPTLLATLSETDGQAGPEGAGSPTTGDPADRFDLPDRCGEWLAALATGDLIATLAMPPRLPFAADAEAAGLVLLAEPDAVSVGRAGTRHRSVDPSRSLSAVTGDDMLARYAAAAVSRAWDLGALATSAQLLGAGRALLEASVRHVSVRAQFGQPVGTFQAVKHKLADVAIALEFARPLLDAAAAAITDGAATAPRDVSAAKVACADAATLAARAALQVHGAIGYTAEHDLSLWLTKVRALAPAWGSQAWHRQRVLAALATSPVSGGEAPSSRPSSTPPPSREGPPRWA